MPTAPTAAQKAPDLGAAQPSGARVRMLIEDTVSAPDLFAQAQQQTAPIQVVDTPAPATVAGHTGVGMTVNETYGGATITRRYLSVSVKQVSVLFVLEAPATEWGQDASTLAGIPGFESG